MNVINGGRHADNTVDFQEFMIAPHGADSFAEAIRKGEETFHALKAILHGKGYTTGVGDEGGFAPDLKSNDEAVEVILEAITKAGFKPGEEISLCLDPATSEMWENGKYVHFKSDKSTNTSEEMVRLWEVVGRQYPIVLIEDGLAENDWQGWKILTSELGTKVELVGDDIFCTNPDDPAARHRRGRRQLDPDQAQPDRYGDGNPADGRARRRATTTTASSRIARARPRIRRSPTSPSQPAPGT